MTARLEPPARKLGAAWEAFWYSKGSTLNLGLFRILFGTALYREVGMTFNKSRFAIEGGFHLPYVWFIQPVTAETYGWIHGLQVPFILLLALGLFTRFSCSALFLLQGYVFLADQMNFRNHPYFFLLVLFLLLFSPADDALSIKSTLRALRNRQPVIASLLGSQQPLTFQRLIQIQVCIVYLFAGFHKLNIAFLSGNVLDLYLSSFFLTGTAGKILEAIFQDAFLTRLAFFLLEPQTLKALSVYTAVLEFVLPLTLWFRKTRPLAILLGISFHLFIFLTLNILNFTLAMIASYLLFLDPETLVARLRATVLRDRPAREGKGSWNLISKIRRTDQG